MCNIENMVDRMRLFVDLVEHIPKNLRNVKFELSNVQHALVAFSKDSEYITKLLQIISVKFSSKSSKLQELSMYPILLSRRAVTWLRFWCDSVYYCRRKLTIFR